MVDTDILVRGVRHRPAPRARHLAPAALALMAAAACAGAARAPTREVTPMPAAASPPPASAPRAASPADSARPRANAADVRFMQQMMAHHAQALAMTALVPARSVAGSAVRLMAERIEVSQRDEIALMRRWLADRGAPVPASDAATAGGHDMAGMDHGASHNTPGMAHGAGAMPLMPGMLTPAELARLAQTTGAAFDRLFLASMIRHHEGALSMVAGFFATPGAGQDAEIFRFASDVDADQRAEIRRMRALLGAS